ncbi:hypothetical protein BO83DRAFT_404419 [Aspergillus eucalypticola CBS 122712]|uniref:Uncharacterized protein n=1 Tax=Aspergillus eucalypticola (strain CBS 122712 / IBT 29274) TaxID=1448314 RepID=A0A317UHK2_ASPEC|nr:uncharacterized protein BO83DRAFT_404419 [Aspergillus eucalypticola CBS 122712]PWY61563.1 hypothetical protein BO83DRAFT_404419 [Aspergillus eucalypticola CBS 122712]
MANGSDPSTSPQDPCRSPTDNASQAGRRPHGLANPPINLSTSPCSDASDRQPARALAFCVALTTTAEAHVTGRWAEEWKGTGVGVGGVGGRQRFARVSTTGVTSERMAA